MTGRMRPFTGLFWPRHRAKAQRRRRRTVIFAHPHKAKSQ